MTLQYVNGDATYPLGEKETPDTKVIMHCCNNRGGWGSGFVLALNRRWKEPEACYRAMGRRKLGTVELIGCEPDVWVANIIGQDGYGRERRKYVQYDALAYGFRTLAAHLNPSEHTIHAPRLGSGLAGGDWDTIEALIQRELVKLNFNVTIYDYP